MGGGKLRPLPFQAQSQGSITLKIIPATQEEGRLKDSKVWWGWKWGRALKQSFRKRSRVWSLDRTLSGEL